MSLPVFESALQTIARGDFSDGELTKAIIGTVGKDSKPLGPRVEGFIGLQRKLYRITDEMRQKKRDDILLIRREEVIASAQQLLDEYRENCVSAAMIDRKTSDESLHKGLRFDKITSLLL
jgi:Zn-dependent M16 (insulinase) family peptidase